ncbi:hypothetical protein FGG08_002635 [Glutinoglossum americanum]|uniref:Arrestin-like N-terminal domain-containing protein n=1 Tax=Glutinoglossum americanum TaxID=1670608 RepID=A0A9P8KZ00_9PEZI|nr:hypothetical protein FGG08_002635 [Glutinoglossum americanum]
MPPVRIQLDQPHIHFTNLDFITGKIALSLFNDEAIAQIIVKLEGESMSRLVAPQLDNTNKRKSETEIHKLLYKTQVVFPSEEIQRQKTSAGGFTLRPGEYQYPFNFKIPINNNCSPINSVYTNLNFVGPRVEIAKNTEKHVKRTLPPSLSGIAGEAEIRYYVKVTVVRPQFYRENYRHHVNFKFFPIEPPRPPQIRGEAYARRPAQFATALSPIPRKKSLFESFRKETPATPNGPPPRFQVDARLPHPSILTCNEAVPLQILVKKLSESPGAPFLSMLHIELIGYTQVKAHDLHKTESTSWIVLTHSNLAIPVGNVNDPINSETRLDPKLWDGIPLPNSVAPTFETCNISRFYELEVRVGLSYGPPGNIKPQIIVLPFRMPVQVFSGIAPPLALLKATARTQNTGMLSPPSSTPSFPISPLSSSSNDRPITPGTPLQPISPLYANRPQPIGETTNDYSNGPLVGYVGAGGDVAPPSYEDAMADEIGPVDGPRRDYSQQTETESSKTGGAVGSGRLFP